MAKSYQQQNTGQGRVRWELLQFVMVPGGISSMKTILFNLTLNNKN